MPGMLNLMQPCQARAEAAVHHELDVLAVQRRRHDLAPDLPRLVLLHPGPHSPYVFFSAGAFSRLSLKPLELSNMLLIFSAGAFSHLSLKPLESSH